jgi:non-canonical purine NTP pyrophosphatase (RdgB/HAM1 family)
LTLLVATTNPNKVKEIRRVLDGAGVEMLTLDEWPDVAAPEETGRTFEDNARLKATYYARATGQVTVAEDSGIEIEALGGVPGVESARYAGEDTSYPEKFARLYAALDRTGTRESAARFVCALAMASPDAMLFEARGVIEGRVAQEPAGAGGFGYDPFFYYPPYGRTLGQVTPAEKLAVSHRGKAFKALREFLASQKSAG